MAADKRAQDLIDLGNRLFTVKLPYDGLCQELAWQFAPDLADFTRKLVLGEEWCDHVMDSFPIQCSRELWNNISGMMRPKGRPWFKTTTLDDDIDADEENAQYLEYVTKTIRSHLYDARTSFVRATKEADRFWVNFGSPVISIEESRTRDHLFFRNHHLKNCAWLENELGDVDHLHRKDAMTARAMVRFFRSDRLDTEIKKAAEKTPGQEFEIRVVAMPRDEYDSSEAGKSSKGGRGKKLPFVLIYVDVTHQKILREEGRVEFPYIVPRWHRFANFQYAFSPATMPGLADGRMAQMLGQILLEAGEKSVNPPLVGGEHAVREANLQAGAISWVDMEYDKKVSDLLTPIRMTGDMSTGFEMRKDLREMLRSSFFLNKLELPEITGQMTATEVQRRLEEHVRNLLPLFEPMEVEYNTRILDKSFAYLRSMNAFDRGAMPDALSEANITWAFESPLQEAQLRLLVEQAKETWQLEALGDQAGASAPTTNPDKVKRDAIRGVGGPAIWRLTAKEQQAFAEAKAKQAQMAQMAATVGHGADVAGKVGDAAQKLRDGGILPQKQEGAGPLPPSRQLPPPTTAPINPAADLGAVAA
jgi:hypothetical protein